MYVFRCNLVYSLSVLPNLPHNLIRNFLGKKWKYIKNNKPISKYEYLNDIHMLINSTFSQFDGKYYRQICGSPIGSCTSHIFAELTALIVMHVILVKWVDNYKQD